MRVGHFHRALGFVLAAVVLPTTARPSQPPATIPSHSDSFPPPEDVFNVSSMLESPLELSRRQDGMVDLRILNLGASIVYGVGSSTGNGYRSFLRDQLRSTGWNVNMVGSKRNGDMKDNDVEANPGDTVDQVATASRNSMAYQPNVVLIQAGSNDCAQNIDTGNAGVRMRKLIEQIFATPGLEKTTIILGTLIPNFDNNIRYCEDDSNAPGGGVNAQYRALASALRVEGKKVVLAEMNPVAPHPGNGWITRDDMSDNTHPNDAGFKKMAYVYWSAIEVAKNEGKLEAPNDVDFSVAKPGCEKKAGDGVYAGGLTQQGSGVDDGIYYHESVPKDIVLTISSGWDRNQWRFARLFSRAKDDLVGWFEQSPSVAAYGVWKNNGDYNTARFDKIADMTVDDNCIPRGVRFIDINGDGLDDFVCIAPNGDAFASINEGNGNANTPPTFHSIGLWKENVGWTQEHIVLADIDGDGRADYCYWDDGGNIWCWRNGWIDDVPKYWQNLGMRFPAKGMGDAHGVRFEDINGDGRDDWLWVRDDGQTTTWTNARSCASGREGDGLNVAWRQGFYRGASEGPTHNGMGSFASTGLRDRIHFARIFGEPQDFGLLGKLDYVFMEHVADGDRHKFNVRVWKNVGGGGTKLKADGVKYCNMMGHPNGNEDYVWTWSKGQMLMYPSRGVGRISPGESWWGPVVDPIWTPPFDIDRRDLHLTDWDGDGACDIVWADSNNGNRVQVWRNKYPDTGRWEWDHYANPAPELTCGQKRGLGIHDVPIRFADVTGNGRGDYLCMEPDGRSSGWVHNDAGAWERINQFKFTEGKDRANLRFADANGDGRADMIWVDKFNGEGWVWYNEGRIPAGGSDFTWRKPSEAAYSGYKAGTCTYYVDMDGDGRADQHSILGTFTNQAETSLNLCGGGGDSSDDSAAQSPSLPYMPGTTPGESGGDSGNSDECAAGTGPGDFEELCGFSCKFGYCPPPCTCTRYGTPEAMPEASDTIGYPANDHDLSYADLCGFSCSRGLCPDYVCQSFFPGGGFIELPNCDKRKWQCHSVDSCGVSDDIFREPKERWDYVDAGLVLSDIQSDWKAGVGLPNSQNDYIFSEYASVRYGGQDDITQRWLGPHPFQCQSLSEGSCTTAQIYCGLTDYVALDLMLISFSHVNQAFKALYDTFNDVNIKGIVNKLSEDFGPDDDEGDLATIKTALEWFDIILGFAGMKTWKDSIQRIVDLGGDISENANFFVGLYETIAGEAAEGKEKEMEGEKNLDNAVNLFIETGKGVADAALVHLFDGSDDGTEQLNALIKDGAFLLPYRSSPSAFNITKNLEAAMRHRLIPAAWASNSDLTPVVIAWEDTGETGRSESPIHLWPWGPLTGEEENTAWGWISDETARATLIDHDGWLLWLVVYFNIPKKSEEDPRWTFREPKGFDKLGPDNTDYNGAVWQDIAVSAFEGWRAADRAQDYSVVKKAGPSGFFYEEDVKTPGFISGIPVCGLDVIHHAHQYEELDNRCSTWPCCCYEAWDKPLVSCSQVPDGFSPYGGTVTEAQMESSSETTNSFAMSESDYEASFLIAKAHQQELHGYDTTWDGTWSS
ncbi:hypothetical protein PFICI_07331 [Pestalotiopsis fici W106-1]|uniref:SGNH hydrolase-type esterase domain-containing protein n=1 Tax=Pestalotiopsis fici (strain W106-1 / CGMCC3.15140) TaxID=1229662 RepID=W3X339_PESFW|nr:uncharacterized protein PFICI_07331 [Pestalotiopsis fici W106-1]ETS79802.1 hypothetical protein PFICI_07331 [Pestalotiopsis fici W106-1]